MISLIAAIGGYNPERVRNFRAFIDCASNQEFDQYEIVIVELVYDKNHFKAISKAAKGNIAYVELPAKEWNRSRGYNAGAQFSKGTVLVFMDADVVFSDDYISTIDKLFDSPYALGWNYSLWLNARGTTLAVGDRQDSIPGDAVDRFLTARSDPNSCKGLSNVFQREFFFDVLGGYNEKFTGWGAEDCEMIFRAKAMAGAWHVLPQTLIHLHHEGRIPGKDNQEIFKCVMEKPAATCEAIKAAGVGDPEQLTGELNDR